ncbi:hypothetical protein E8E13_008858 [Curvularia kusanoi]|uniref:Pentatricopeptide repeat-containing protein n=1 Tax=Curvularia kusanoi TaxID=90978 RepID=A0A9P4TCT1_CURKU|nr:hypothetical protein E8E13_008858 [Curvularia kusanoi]
MLAPHRLRCLLHSVPALQTRQLRTRPRPIPRYTRQWNPTLHKPATPSGTPNEPCLSVAPAQITVEQPSLDATFEALSLDADETTISRNVAIAAPHRGLSESREFKKLNYLLNLADSKDNLEPGLRAPIWQAYTMAMKRRVNTGRYLSKWAWNVLWKSQYADFSDPSRRRVRLARIDRYLRNARAEPIAGQIAYRAERNFMAGREDDAFDMWTRHYDENATASEYLDTGIRLYALAGHPDTARRFMDVLLRLHPDWDTSIMTTVFRGYTSSLEGKHHDEARKLYCLIKGRMGLNGDQDAYDACLAGFLEARLLEDALEVFRDMIRHDSLETKTAPGELKHRYVAGVIRRLNSIYALATDVSAMTSIALAAINVLPVVFHSHVYSDWLNSAIVETSPQAAASILDLMIQRGYQPETEHFNSLLRILYRTKAPENILKAENIGWKMIEETPSSQVVSDRPPFGSRVNAIVNKLHNYSATDARFSTTMPAASTTTFALTMRHHALNEQWEHVDYLTRRLREQNVEVNSTIMNVMMENSCQQGNFVEAWQMYKNLTGEPDQVTAVFPDGQSIRVLWKILRLALSDPENRNNPSLPTPRQLLHETSEWWTLIRQRPDVDRFKQGLAAADMGAIAKLVLHCFSYARDIPGVLVALHFLREKFGIHATDELVQIVLRQLAWTVLEHESETVRLQFGLGKNRIRAIKKLRHQYWRWYKRKLEFLGIHEEDLPAYSEDEAYDLQLNVISEFVRTVMLADVGPEEVEELIQDAATAAGVPYMMTGDMNVFDMIAWSDTELN